MIDREADPAGHHEQVGGEQVACGLGLVVGGAEQHDRAAELIARRGLDPRAFRTVADDLQHGVGKVAPERQEALDQQHEVLVAVEPPERHQSGRPRRAAGATRSRWRRSSSVSMVFDAMNIGLRGKKPRRKSAPSRP